MKNTLLDSQLVAKFETPMNGFFSLSDLKSPIRSNSLPTSVALTPLAMPGFNLGHSITSMPWSLLCLILRQCSCCPGLWRITSFRYTRW